MPCVRKLGIVGPPPTPNPCGGFNPWAATAAGYFQPALPPGTHTYSAVYSGDAFYAPSTSPPITVVVPPRPGVIPTTMTLDGGADPFTGNTSLYAMAQACPTIGGAPGPTGTIKFFEGATLLTTVTVTGIVGPPPTPNPCGGFNPWAATAATYFQPGLPPGTHTYSAVYSGDAFYAPSTSAPVTINVTNVPPVTPGQSFGGPTSTLSGDATVNVSGGGALCGFTRAAFVPVAGGPNSPSPGSAPPGLSFPHGLVAFMTSGCTPGSTLTFTMTFPAGGGVPTAYWKYGPTPGNATPHWYQMPATLLGNVVTFSIVDGGLGDDDLTANGTVVDAGGPTADSLQAIPTLSAWALRFTMLLVAFAGALAMRRSHR